MQQGKPFQIFKRAGWLWYNKDAERAAAAVSYWAAFTLVPLLFFITLMASLVYDDAYVASVLTSWGVLLGDDLLSLLFHATTNLRETQVPIIGPLIFLGVAVLGVNEFTNGLHSLWGLPHQGLRGFIKKCLFSSLFILFLSILTFFALTMHTPFILLEHASGTVSVYVYTLVSLLHTFLIIILLTFLFTIAFMLLPFSALRFKSSLFGGFVAAVLFSLGKLLIAIYANYTPVPLLYGTAGVVVVLLIWIFFSCCVIYYGAAVAKAHAELST